MGADHIIAVLDRMEVGTEAEDGGEAEPALAAPENHHGSQVVWLRNNDSDRETKEPETTLPVVAAERKEAQSWLLPWSGSGNVVAAAGVALLGMVSGR